MNDIHSCNYYCDKTDCIKAQRDEMRGWFFDQQTFAALQQKLAASERECEKHKNAVAVYNQDCIAAERRIAELENQQQAITALCNYAKVCHPSELLVKVGELEAQLDQSCNAEELRQVRAENAALREDAFRALKEKQ